MGDYLKGVEFLTEEHFQSLVDSNSYDEDVVYVTDEDVSSTVRTHDVSIKENATNISVNKKDIAQNATEIQSLKNTTNAQTENVTKIKNDIQEIILRDSEQDSKIKNIEENFATKEFVVENGGKIDYIAVNGVDQTITDKRVNIIVPDISNIETALQNTVNLSTAQTITGPKTFTEHIYLANADGTIDRISHLNNNFIIHSGATNSAVLNIDEGLEKIYAFNKELAFKSDIAEAAGTTVYVDSTGVASLSFSADPQTQINLLATSIDELNEDVSNQSESINGKLDRVDGSTQTQVYGVGSSGNQVMFAVTQNPTNSAIVRRYGNQIKVPAQPVDEDDATSKQYVDTTVSTAIAGLGTVFDFKGSKDTSTELPTENNVIGDVWYVISEEVGYIWLNDGTTDRWERFGAPIDLSGYLPLSGGTITGDVVFPNFKTGIKNEYGYILEASGESDDGKSDLGVVLGGRHTQTTLRSNGELRHVRGNDSGYGAYLLDTRNYKDYLVPKTGGNFTGDLTVKNVTVATVNDIPNVPDWAMSENKPEYDYDEILNTPDVNFDAIDFAEEERKKSNDNLFDLFYNGDVEISSAYYTTFSEHLKLKVNTNMSGTSINQFTITSVYGAEGVIYTFDCGKYKSGAWCTATLINLKPNTEYALNFTVDSYNGVSGECCFMGTTHYNGAITKKGPYTRTFVTDDNGEYSFAEGIHLVGSTNYVISHVQLVELNKYDTYQKYYGPIVHQSTMLNTIAELLSDRLSVKDYYIDPLQNTDSADTQTMSYVVTNPIIGNKCLKIIWGGTPLTASTGFLSGAPSGEGWLPTSSAGVQAKLFTSPSNYRTLAVPYGGTQFNYGWRVVNYLVGGYGGINVRYGNTSSGIRFNYFIIGLEE